MFTKLAFVGQAVASAGTVGTYAQTNSATANNVKSGSMLNVQQTASITLTGATALTSAALAVSAAIVALSF